MRIFRFTYRGEEDNVERPRELIGLTKLCMAGTVQFVRHERSSDAKSRPNEGRGCQFNKRLVRFFGIISSAACLLHHCD